MSDGGFLPMARELRREVGVPLRLAAELAAWRAGRTYFDETQAMILFGIGLDTIQRIERGKVEPEPDIAERIARVIHNIHPHSPASPSAADVSPATPHGGKRGRCGAFPPGVRRTAALAGKRRPGAAPLVLARQGGQDQQVGGSVPRGDAARRHRLPAPDRRGRGDDLRPAPAGGPSPAIPPVTNVNPGSPMPNRRAEPWPSRL
jgi:DNA-binding XRE family transcriptional regulator